MRLIVRIFNHSIARRAPWVTPTSSEAPFDVGAQETRLWRTVGKSLATRVRTGPTVGLDHVDSNRRWKCCALAIPKLDIDHP